MFREIYYEYSRLVCRALKGYCVARSIAFLAVKGCVNGVLGLCWGHGKSPCFSGWGFSIVFGVDGKTLFFSHVDGAVLHE